MTLYFIASLVIISQPIGALLAGPLMDYLGRKKAGIITNIPMLVSWMMIYFTEYSLWPIYIARILAGLSSGKFNSIRDIRCLIRK